jgi:NADPH2:quinone reductase
MATIRAVIVDSQVPGRLALREVEEPSAAPSEAIVRVVALSLNRGEIRRARAAKDGWRPGWDFAGTVERAAADGSGPAAGARVVGLLNPGAWAELVAAPTTALAELPAAVSFAQAATLPVAGLTALRTLEKGGLLVGHSVLITGASGGVGQFACQIARHAGAHVVGSVRQAEHREAAQDAGAHQVVIGEDLEPARQFGPYHLILESVGGGSLAAALTILAPDGVCVSFGVSAAPQVTFDAAQFYLTGGATLYGFILFHENVRNPPSADLGRLATMVAEGWLRPRIDIEAPWTQIADIAQQLWDRRFPGKAVLHVSG